MKKSSRDTFKLPGSLIDAHVARYTVGIVLVRENSAQLAGSGTLISCGGIAGILTCAHVVDNLRAFERAQAQAKANAMIGLVCSPVIPSRHQNFQIPLNALDEFVIGSGNLTSRGPDLAFLKLPSSAMGSLSAIASVVSIETQTELQELAPRPHGFSADILAGYIEEKTTQTRTNNAITIQFNGLMNVAKMRKVLPPKSGCDRWIFTPQKPDVEPAPSSYEGTSGGGIWRLGLKRTNTGSSAVIDSRLVGVVYFETDKTENRGRELIGHGPRSLYLKMFPAIQRRWPSH